LSGCTGVPSRSAGPLISTVTAAMPAFTRSTAPRARHRPRQPDRRRARRHAAVRDDSWRQAGRAAGGPPHHTADTAGRTLGGRRVSGRRPDREHGRHRGDVRHRRWPAAHRDLTRRSAAE
jgi:hypothetical protein